MTNKGSPALSMVIFSTPAQHAVKSAKCFQQRRQLPILAMPTRITLASLLPRHQLLARSLSTLTNKRPQALPLAIFSPPVGQVLSHNPEAQRPSQPTSRQMIVEIDEQRAAGLSPDHAFAICWPHPIIQSKDPAATAINCSPDDCRDRRAKDRWPCFSSLFRHPLAKSFYATQRPSAHRHQLPAR